jgi:hypothetical protein
MCHGISPVPALARARTGKTYRLLTGGMGICSTSRNSNPSHDRPNDYACASKLQWQPHVRGSPGQHRRKLSIGLFRPTPSAHMHGNVGAGSDCFRDKVGCKAA